ncbi:MAG: hypothetical protein M0P61_18275 [Ignavibacteriaceae bacterium]|jgi:hypothetical protein|nr:hypothetical protein [Ignavibacteriaceae bacterium]
MSEKLIEFKKFSQSDLDRILRFCSGCDFLVNKENQSVIGCSSPTKFDSQSLSAFFDSCLDAQKNGKSGTMSDYGFCRKTP